LIEQVSQMDGAAWTEFTKLYSPLLWSYIGSCCKRYDLSLNEHDREDLRQDILVKLHKVLPGFKLDREGRGHFRTWLWAVTRNAAIDSVRRARGPEASCGLEFDPHDRGGATPDQELIQEHMRQVLRHILERVQADMQSCQKWACFQKHFLEKQRSAQVAAELGLSVSAVNTNTSRVLARIREWCTYYDIEPF
jgi:RNA polymerase sigma factor (sigma-70 family)